MVVGEEAGVGVGRLGRPGALGGEPAPLRILAQPGQPAGLEAGDQEGMVARVSACRMRGHSRRE